MNIINIYDIINMPQRITQVDVHVTQINTPTDTTTFISVTKF